MEVAAKDYENRRGRGELLHLRKAREKAFLQQKVKHSYSEDGKIRYGDVIMLEIESDKGLRYLANSIFDQVSPGNVRVTAGSNSEAQARNTFILQRPSVRADGASGVGPGPDVYENTYKRAPGIPLDDVLRYGDHVYIACHPSLVIDESTGVAGLPYLLQSTRANNILGTVVRGKQEVVMSQKRGPDAEWIITGIQADRLLHDGQIVYANESVQLVHAMSGISLCGTATVTYPTEFGVELDVHCANHRSVGHTQMKRTGDINPAMALKENQWRFVMSSTPAPPTSLEEEYTPLTAQNLLDRARGIISAAAGVHGFRSIQMAFEVAVSDAIVPRPKGTDGALAFGRNPLAHTDPLSGTTSRGPVSTGLVLKTTARDVLYQHGVRFSDMEFNLLLEPFEYRSESLPLNMTASNIRTARHTLSSTGIGVSDGRHGVLIRSDDLLDALRGDIFESSERRQEVARAAYEYQLQLQLEGGMEVALGQKQASTVDAVNERYHQQAQAAMGTMADNGRGTGFSFANTSSLQSREPTIPPQVVEMVQRAHTNGEPCIGGIKRMCDVQWDPRVMAKLLTQREAKEEFLRQWPTHRQSFLPVTFDDWMFYMRDVSAAIPNDEDFINFVANTWHIPNRGYWREKFGKKVLITFAKGSSTEAVIPHGEDIPDDDQAALTAALEKIGFGGIARVKVLGLIEPTIE